MAPWLARVCAPRRLSDCSDQLVGERNLAYTQSHSGPYVPHKRKQGIKRKTLEIQLVCDSITPYGRTIMVCTRMQSTRETKFGRSHQSQDTGLTIVSPLECYLPFFYSPRCSRRRSNELGRGKGRRRSDMLRAHGRWSFARHKTHIFANFIFQRLGWSTPKRVSDYQPHG